MAGTLLLHLCPPFLYASTSCHAETLQLHGISGYMAALGILKGADLHDTEEAPFKEQPFVLHRLGHPIEEDGMQHLQQRLKWLARAFQGSKTTSSRNKFSQQCQGRTVVGNLRCCSSMAAIRSCSFFHLSQGSRCTLKAIATIQYKNAGGRRRRRRGRGRSSRRRR